jgi:hypothetical protein
VEEEEKKEEEEINNISKLSVIIAMSHHSDQLSYSLLLKHTKQIFPVLPWLMLRGMRTVIKHIPHIPNNHACTFTHSS